MKTAWIDEENRIVSFHEIPGATPYVEVAIDFWSRVLRLTSTGYRIM